MTPYYLLFICWLWLKVVRAVNWLFGKLGSPGLFNSEIEGLTTDLAGAKKYTEPFDPLEELTRRILDDMSNEGKKEFIEVAKRFYTKDKGDPQ